MSLPRGRTGCCVAAAAVLSCLAPASSAAMPSGEDGLSPELVELAKPSVRSKSEAAQARIIGVAEEGPGSLVRAGDQVLVNVRFDRGAIASEGAIEEAGGEVLDASGADQTATVAVAPADLPSLADVGTIASITPVRAPVLYEEKCEGGSVISEGVHQLGVDTARSEFRPELAVDGSGIKVGVLSDSYNRATKSLEGTSIATKAPADEASADLPGSSSGCEGETTATEVLADSLSSTEATDEGRAMLQIVHDVAPKAALSFASAFESEESFAKNIEALASKGANVIVDDVAWFEEPFFQDGLVAAAINRVTSKGVSYLTAAGNDNLFDSQGREIASWEAPQFRDSGSCPSSVEKGVGSSHSHCMDFNPGTATDQTFGITVEPEEVLTVDLQWAEPWNGVGTDIDAYLLNSAGSVLTKSVKDNPGETQRPVEIVQWQNPSSSASQTVQLVINRYSGSAPRLKFALLENGRGVSATEYPESSGGDVVGPTVYGHAGDPNAIAVGAVRYNGTSPEPYSSRGPVLHYFGPVEGSAAAAALSTPEVISKPDVAATDCGATTFFAQKVSGVWRFCGTSAAAPHAAGVVALMRQAAPLATPAQLREALVGASSALPGYGPCAVGGGLIEAAGALSAILTGTSESGLEGCKAPASHLEPSEPETSPSTSIPVQASPIAQSEPQAQAIAPSTGFSKHPRKVVRTKGTRVKLGFGFKANQAGVSFLCKFDRGRFRLCGATVARFFALGAHSVAVKARGATGLVDSTPAVFRFRVAQAR